MTIDPSMLEAFVRNNLNLTAPRTMVVLEPLKVNIRNFAFLNKMISVPDFPDNPEKGSHEITFSPTIYIEKSDLNVSANVEKGYRRLTREQEVGLRYANFIMKLVKVHQPRNGANPAGMYFINLFLPCLLQISFKVSTNYQRIQLYDMFLQIYQKSMSNAFLLMNIPRNQKPSFIG